MAGRSAKALLPLAVLAALALPHAAFARPYTPPGFFGISPQNAPNEGDYHLMEESRVTSLRLPLPWNQVEPVNPYVSPPDWSAFDAAVALAAQHGMRVFPFVSYAPEWVTSPYFIEPTAHGWQRRAWARFLHQAVNRYGAGGLFWQENRDIPYLPIRAWEVWNEENIVTFGRADPASFARLLRISGRAIHRADRGAKVILGGLFGRPLQIPPNVAPGPFLNAIYRSGNVKPFFDGVGLHPYVASARALPGEIRNLRRVMRRHRDGRTPIYLTEMGWGSDGYESRWERGWHGQARELNRSFSMLARHRLSWRIGGVWWFTWADIRHGCQFCDSAGLLNEAREAKPAWYRFNAWTHGDAGTVPRAKFER